MAEEYASEWSRIPIPLQHQFFRHASEETGRLKERMTRFVERVVRFGRELSFLEIPECEEWREWRIAVVDGSFPPMSERIGVRMGLYCAGYLIFEGKRLVPGGAGYRSGVISKAQTGDPWKTGKTLELLCTKLEREVALHCLEEEGVDYVLIDGSFFGFQSMCQLIRDLKIDVQGYEYGADLVDEVRDLSMQLLRTRRAVGVVKRARTAAFDGYVLYRTGREDECFDENDRAVLTWIMPERSYFAYKWLFGSPGTYQYYSNLRGVYHMYVKYHGEPDSMDAVLSECMNVTQERIRNNLNCDPRAVLEAARYYVRCAESVPPFCVEAHKDLRIGPMLAYFLEFHNPATGLPFPVDLMDQEISLPADLVREFVEEVEAGLLRFKELREGGIRQYFTYIGLQKEE